MTLTRQALEFRGFSGFVPFSDLAVAAIHTSGGIHVVVRTGDTDPVFLPTSTAGWRKQRDPSASVEKLMQKWVNGAEVLYTLAKRTPVRPAKISSSRQAAQEKQTVPRPEKSCESCTSDKSLGYGFLSMLASQHGHPRHMARAVISTTIERSRTMKDRT